MANIHKCDKCGTIYSTVSDKTVDGQYAIQQALSDHMCEFYRSRCISDDAVIENSKVCEHCGERIIWPKRATDDEIEQLLEAHECRDTAQFTISLSGLMYGDTVESLLRDMSAFDRQLVQECKTGSGAIQRYDMAVPTKPRNKRHEVLANELHIEHVEAHRLITAWETIDDSSRIWNQLKDNFIETRLFYRENGLEDDQATAESLKIVEQMAEQLLEVEYQPTMLSGSRGITYIDDLAVESGDCSEDDDTLDGDDTALVDFGETLPIDASDIWIDRDGNEWVDSVDTRPDQFHLVSMNNSLGEPLQRGVYDARLRAFWAAQPHAKRFASLCKAAQNAKTPDLHKIRKALWGKDKLTWLSRAQRTRLWAIVNGRKRDLDLTKSQWVRKLRRSMTAVESRKLAELKAAKSEKQVKYYWHLLLSGPLYGIRPTVQEYVLKPALAERAQTMYFVPLPVYNVA